ncbi:MAG TPA: DUF4942 domain-containing protein, partial [Phototrophicaceae bacterium]|nr:DUF4942 domain-containing protein [Phototrophicaceae bacterium]
RDQIIQECIVSVFDTATKYHEKNVVHTEGWKTNKSWRIAPKIIMPYGVTHEPKWNGWRMNYHHRDFFLDIDKALCFLAGKTLDQIDTVEQAIDHQLAQIANHDQRHDEPFTSTFFEIRVFKKGTVHLTFKDKNLLARFNQAAALGKNWVGAGY